MIEKIKGLDGLEEITFRPNYPEVKKINDLNLVEKSNENGMPINSIHPYIYYPKYFKKFELNCLHQIKSVLVL